MKVLKSYFVFLFILLSLTFGSVCMNDTTSVYANVQETNGIQTKVPIGRKALAMKFLLAMLGVGASSVVIYVGLSVYNRFIYGTVKPKLPKGEDESYKTPNNMKDAIEIFLRKTK